MIKRICNALIALLAGLIGTGVLTLLLYLITFGFDKLEIYFFLLALPILFNPLYEEVAKYLSIKIWNIETFNGFFFGLGWAGLEAFSRHLARGDVTLTNRIAPTLLHISTAIILCYFVKRKKPVLGLVIAIAIHAGYNLFVVKIK